MRIVNCNLSHSLGAMTANAQSPFVASLDPGSAEDLFFLSSRQKQEHIHKHIQAQQAHCVLLLHSCLPQKVAARHSMAF